MWPIRRRRRKRKRRHPSDGAAETQVARKEKRSHTARVNFIYGVVFVAFAGLILRTGYLQIAKGDFFRNQATTTSLNRVPVLPARGYIYDRNGNLLAYDKPSYNVYLTQIPHVVQNYQQMAAILAPVFHMDPDKLYQTMESDTSLATATLFKGITDAQLAFILEHQSELPGISVVLDSQRTYPQGDLAGKVLGYIGAITPQTEAKYEKLGYLPNQKVGEAGIELEYEKRLQGQVGYQVVETTASGTQLKKLGFDPPPTPGQYLQLTLDGRLQAFTQNYVYNLINASKYRNQIQNASAVMLDVKTGGVLALVSYPYLDPNWFPSQVLQHQKYLSRPFVQYNTVIQASGAPGSTVKPANLLTALQAGVVTPQTVFPDHLVTMIGSYPIHDDGAHGLVTPSYAITVSCDSFFYHVGLELGRWLGSTSTSGGGPPSGEGYLTWLHRDFIKGLTALYQGEARFGLGELTHIDLPGEQPGKFLIDKNYSKVPLDLKAAEASIRKTGAYDNSGTPVDLAFAGIGQAQQFTPIELAQYVMTIADNGVKLQPHLLQAVYPSNMQQRLTPQMKPLQTFGPTVQANLNIPSPYLKIVQQGMYGVVNNPNGTAYGDFANAPYKAAGKTGTAQLGANQDNSVFIAYAPYDKPEVAVAVMVPGAGYGSDTAAPIARAMLDEYFKEHHEFFPKDQWVSTDIPANWTQSAAYRMPEQGH
ncbi:MAG: peptidoglycan glycosyltransferase [Alicyclobacillus sp.]|nr:peptidoglycan glycosyltransferase [Alicyclobacillus sp.]